MISSWLFSEMWTFCCMIFGPFRMFCHLLSEMWTFYHMICLFLTLQNTPQKKGHGVNLQLKPSGVMAGFSML
jgi:hypothetical protein